MSIETKLRALKKKTLADGRHGVAAACTHLLEDLGDLDRQINLVGALHETGALKNSLGVYWKEFRGDEAAWIARCLSRLSTLDHDYWALAALLGCQGAATVAAAREMGFKSATQRTYPRWDLPDVLVDTLYLQVTGSVLHPVLEIGIDSRDGTAVDLGRARALSLSDQAWSEGSSSIGDGYFSLYMEARLPYGSWRERSARFDPFKKNSEDA